MFFTFNIIHKCHGFGVALGHRSVGLGHLISLHYLWFQMSWMWLTSKAAKQLLAGYSCCTFYNCLFLFLTEHWYTLIPCRDLIFMIMRPKKRSSWWPCGTRLFGGNSNFFSFIMAHVIHFLLHAPYFFSCHH